MIDDKLRPCPFCGENGKPYFSRSVNGTRLITCGCNLCGFHSKAVNIYDPRGNYDTKDVRRIWNNADCWKQLSSSQEKIKRLREAVEDAMDSSFCTDTLNPRNCLHCRMKKALTDTEDKS
jgi:hypothetical protein